MSEGSVSSDFASYLIEVIRRSLEPEPWSRRWWRALGREMLAEFRASWREHAVPGNYGAERDRERWLEDREFWDYAIDRMYWRLRAAYPVVSPHSVLRVHGLTS